MKNYTAPPTVDVVSITTHLNETPPSPRRATNYAIQSLHSVNGDVFIKEGTGPAVLEEYVEMGGVNQEDTFGRYEFSQEVRIFTSTPFSCC